MTPPRTAERLLGSLGARPEFRDPLLGDMDEEYADRVRRHGEQAARRWYWRESLRTAPHLVHDWRRSLAARDVRRLGSVVLASYCFTMMLVFPRSPPGSTSGRRSPARWPWASCGPPARLSSGRWPPGGHGMPLWYRLSVPIVLMFATTFGGVLRVRAIQSA
jgi:hypothetical protein